GPVLYRPLPYRRAPIALSPVLVPEAHRVPVSLAPISSHESSGLGKLMGLEKFEKLLPLQDLLKSGLNLEGLLGSLGNIDLPGLTINLPDGPGPKELVDQIVAASDKVFPAIRLPEKAPIIAPAPSAMPV